jgi:hypothetical protein
MGKRMARNGTNTITCILLKRKNRINIFYRRYFWVEGNEMMQNTIHISYSKGLKSFDKTRISFVVKIREES